ncbi:hypothetical protein U472_06435 [Orenia metallireducens]|uniref:YceG-like family protein n=1 Tax=Orenia metallireducens TaxID=1413210 RepID=A0A1C0A9Z4_9FIRM|nr:hypothetical protein [Orenia metallireducens]OCL27114.1 hypothetical protein U472_06435 [Orenia metallireducens]
MLRHTLLGIGITLVIMALVLSLDINLPGLNLQKETVITESEIIKEARKLGMTFPGESYSHEDISLERNFSLEGVVASLKEGNVKEEAEVEEIVDESLSVQDNNIAKEEVLVEEQLGEALEIEQVELQELSSETKKLEERDTSNDNSKEVIDPMIKEDKIEEVLKTEVEEKKDNDDSQEKLKEELTRQLKEQLKEELKKEIKEELERENKKVLVTIPKGISSREVATLLIHQGVIDDRNHFIAVADELELDTKIKAGTYSFQLPISVKEVLVQLTSIN